MIINAPLCRNLSLEGSRRAMERVKVKERWELLLCERRSYESVIFEMLSLMTEEGESVESVLFGKLGLMMGECRRVESVVFRRLSLMKRE